MSNGWTSHSAVSQKLTRTRATWKGVYAGIFCSECWALDERSGNTPNGSVILNGPLTAETERLLAESPHPVVTRHVISDTALGLSVESSFEVRQRTNKGV